MCAPSHEFFEILCSLHRSALPWCCGGDESAADGIAQGRVREWFASSSSPDGAQAATKGGVWAAPHIREQHFGNGVRVWEVAPQHMVALVPLPAGRHAYALGQLQHCDAGWDTLAATQKALDDGEINSFRCTPTPRQAEESLSVFNEHALTRRVLRNVFNVTQPCRNIYTGSELWGRLVGKSSARQWLTALHSDMAEDSWHPGLSLSPPPPSLRSL